MLIRLVFSGKALTFAESLEKAKKKLEEKK